MRAVEVDADLRACALPVAGPLSGFPHCLQRAGVAGRRRWDIHGRRAKGLLDFLSIVLLAQGHAVTCVNRGLRGAVAPGARLVRADRRERAAFERTLQAERFDAVIDMLCFTRADAHSSLRAYRDVPHVVQCSTVCTYGIAYDWLPVTEDHPLRPITPYGQQKAAADATLLEAYARTGFPVTILKPSTTYGPMQGMLRQIAWEFSWIDRIRQGKPLVVCGQGNALHQHLHVEDAARGFAQVLGKAQCLGQIYNLVSEPPITWATYHRTAMQVLRT